MTYTNQDFIIAIERSLLSSYIYCDLTSDFESISNHQIDFKIFTSNITIKSVAKAIYNFQKDDIPLDEDLICNYITKHMALDYDEYFKILKAKMLPYSIFLQYEKELIKNINNQKIGDIYARI